MPISNRERRKRIGNLANVVIVTATSDKLKKPEEKIQKSRRNGNNGEINSDEIPDYKTPTSLNDVIAMAELTRYIVHIDYNSTCDQRVRVLKYLQVITDTFDSAYTDIPVTKLAEPLLVNLVYRSMIRLAEEIMGKPTEEIEKELKKQETNPYDSIELKNRLYEETGRQVRNYLDIIKLLFKGNIEIQVALWDRLKKTQDDIDSDICDTVVDLLANNTFNPYYNASAAETAKKLRQYRAQKRMMSMQTEYR